MPRNSKNKNARKRINSKKMRIAVLPNLATERLIITMPWMMTGVDGTAAPGFVVRTLVLNDIYNIDSAGVATSRPQMYDQLALLYQNFKVISVKVTDVVTISDGYRHMHAFAPRRVSAAPSSVSQCVLRKGSKWGVVTMYEKSRLTSSYTCRDLAGPSYVDADYTGQYNASPSKSVAIDLATSPTTNNATSITYFTYIEFKVEWSQRRNTANA